MGCNSSKPAASKDAEQKRPPMRREVIKNDNKSKPIESKKENDKYDYVNSKAMNDLLETHEISEECRDAFKKHWSDMAKEAKQATYDEKAKKRKQLEKFKNDENL